jgi:hypothetical protein
MPSPSKPLKFTVLGLARKVRESIPGHKQHGRNVMLFWAACRAREHIDAGRLDDHTAREALRVAALDVGLGEQEIAATLRSALDTTRAAA